MAIPASKIEIEAVETQELSPYRAESLFQFENFSGVLSHRLIISAFAVINICLAILISRSSGFINAQSQISALVETVSLILALAAVVFAGAEFFVAAYKKIQSSILGYEVCTAAGLLTFSVAIIVQYFKTDISVTYQALALTLIIFFLLLDSLWSKRWENTFNRRLGHWLWHPDNKSFTGDKECKVGEIVEFTPGEYLTCDGEIVSGLAEVYERRYSGYGAPKMKGAGQPIYAGSKILRGALHVKIATTPDESMLGYFGSLLEDRIFREVNLEKNSNYLEALFSALILFGGACAALYLNDQGATLTESLMVGSGVFFLTLIPRVFRILPKWDSAVMLGAFMRGALLKGKYCTKLLERIRTLLTFSSSNAPVGKQRVRDIELLDLRVDPKSLDLALLSLLSCSEDDSHAAVVQHLFQKVKVATPYPVSEPRVYSGRGVCGLIDGTDFSVGTEEFMIERGVQLQASDVITLAKNEKMQLVAAGDEVVARIHLYQPLEKDGKEMVRKHKSLGIRTILCGEDGPDTVDEIGKSMGLELIDVHGGLNETTLLDHVRRFKPLAYYSASNTHAKAKDEADLSMIVFDELLWDLEAGDVLLFDQGAELIGQVFLFFRKQRILRIVGISVSILLTAALVVALILQALSPLELVAIVAVVSAVFYARVSSVIGSRELIR